MGVAQLALRAWEFTCTVIVMGLIGNVISEAFSGNPATINYTMFVVAFALFTLFYLIPTSFKSDWAVHPVFPIVFDTLNTIFFLTAAIALSAKLEAHSCSNENYTLNNEITNGSSNPEKRCREAQASTAFLWFGWVAWTASMILSIFAARRAGADLRPRTGPARGRPSMAQV
ncbi:MARVEL domain-containing protein [Aspergillus lucknowensis]|uniref:Marvel domain-containing protein n=1 Tax=Aspergillus lucknowensis TaxID=176173 RepID=A0ABR4LUE9_9EURO